MRIIVDTNIAFSAILNTNSKIGKIILHPKSKLNLYSTDTLKYELEEHSNKLKKLSGFSEEEFKCSYSLVLSRIRFINIEVIPLKLFNIALDLCSNIDPEDTEFVALQNTPKGSYGQEIKYSLRGLRKEGGIKLSQQVHYMVSS